MNSKNLMVASALLNVLFVPTGMLYLRQKIKPVKTDEVSVPESLPDFTTTLDYTWQKEVFESQPTAPGAIVFLGDSLTASGLWQYVWQGKTVLNRGAGGDTIEGVTARLDEVLRHKPKKVFLMIGINDLTLYGKSPDYLIGRYKILLQKIETSSSSTAVYIQSLLPTRLPMNAIIPHVNEKLRALADEKNVHFVDVNSPMCDAQGQLQADWTPDGVHIKAAGYQEWRKVVGPLID
jgi:lysophospholipase L1-like esterase